MLHLLLDLVALDVDVCAVRLSAPDEDRAGSSVDGVGVHGHVSCRLRPNSALVWERLPLRLQKIDISKIILLFFVREKI